MNDTMIIIMYLLMAYGLTNLIVFGKGPFDLLVTFRTIMGKISYTFEDMLSCMMCTSANVGWILSLLNILFLPSLRLTPFNIIIDNNNLWYLIIILDMTLTSGVVWLIHSVQEMCERIGTTKNED